mmetsp:Transcript_16356/g.39945  ORF Transcript_16356/g.39945 Transcript_16356/m.39945 type:complete len:248 (-) Transcript_16356:53-796(-)
MLDVVRTLTTGKSIRTRNFLIRVDLLVVRAYRAEIGSNRTFTFTERLIVQFIVSKEILTKASSRDTIHHVVELGTDGLTAPSLVSRKWYVAEAQEATFFYCWRFSGVVDWWHCETWWWCIRSSWTTDRFHHGYFTTSFSWKCTIYKASNYERASALFFRWVLGVENQVWIWDSILAEINGRVTTRKRTRWWAADELKLWQGSALLICQKASRNANRNSLAINHPEGWIIKNNRCRVFDVTATEVVIA